MSLYWYACISINTNLYIIYNILLGTIWWVFSNASSIMWIHLAIHEILANKTFTVTNSLISQLFVVAFLHPTYVQIAIIWGFPVMKISLLVMEIQAEWSLWQKTEINVIRGQKWSVILGILWLAYHDSEID